MTRRVAVPTAPLLSQWERLGEGASNAGWF